MLKYIFQNCAYPKGRAGSLMLAIMNIGHAPLSRWGLANLNVPYNAHILDIGCGGGKNVARLLQLAPKGRVYGLDYAEASVIKSVMVNNKAIALGRAQIVLGEVSNLPFGDSSFDVVTAFETIYFWPSPARDFAEVWRVLKPGGVFFICNALQKNMDTANKDVFWTKIMSMQLYGGMQLQELLQNAQFGNIEIKTDAKQKKLCVLAYKS